MKEPKMPSSGDSKSRDVPGEGMTEEQIYKKLEGLENSIKIEYLNKILEKKNILDERAKYFVYQTLGELYNSMAKFYEKSVGKKIVKKISNQEQLESLKEVYGSRNTNERPMTKEEHDEEQWMQRAWQSFDWYDMENNKNGMDSLAKSFMDRGYFYDAAKVYEKINDKEGIKIVADKMIDDGGGHIVHALELYEKLNNKKDMEKIAERLMSEERFWDAGIFYKSIGDKEGIKRAAEGLVSIGKYKEAINLYDEINILESDDLNALKNLVRAYEGVNNTEKAADVKKRIKNI
jgi:hypothetical protein